MRDAGEIASSGLADVIRGAAELAVAAERAQQRFGRHPAPSRGPAEPGRSAATVAMWKQLAHPWEALLAGGRTVSPMPEAAATRILLHRAMGGRCPGCDLHLAGHSIRQVGVTVARPETSERVRAFIRDFDSQSWPALARYREFEGAFNAIEVYALHCPAGRNAALLLRDPAELYDSASVLSSQVLEADSWAILANVENVGEWLDFEEAQQ